MDPDHRLMTPPFLRLKQSRGVSPGQAVAVWDLRIAQPNVSHVASEALHSLEHFLGVLLPAFLPGVVNVAPLGCQTGFYIVTAGAERAEDLFLALEHALAAVLDASEVPLADTRACGRADHHSLSGAKAIAEWLLLRRPIWDRAVMEGP